MSDTTLPSQFELATLAAALDSSNNTPAATAARALAVWRACGKTLATANHRLALTAAADAKAAQLRLENGKFVPVQKVTKKPKPAPVPQDFIPLLDFLKPHFSKNSKGGDMVEKYRRFVRDGIAFDDARAGKTRTEIQMLDAVGDAMGRDRKEGIPVHLAPIFSESFAKFLQRDSAVMNSSKGHKGQAGRKAKADARGTHDHNWIFGDENAVCTKCGYTLPKSSNLPKRGLQSPKAALIEPEKAAKKTGGEKKSLGGQSNRPKQKKTGRK